MAVEWTEHRFAGGALALDVANTVVLRIDPQKCFDRFDDPSELRFFAEAAMANRSEELDGRRLHVARPETEKPRMIALRESIDALFRDAADRTELSLMLLPPLLGACAESIGATGQEVDKGIMSLEAATALSAINLLAPEQRRRIRICDNCGWLFLDRSRNGSRRWCDMTVCGNRIKAQRHYDRKRKEARQ